MNDSKCPPNADLRIPSICNQMKKNVCKFVFNCIQENICDQFKGYFQRSKHEKFTRNNSNNLALPLLMLKFGQKPFAFAAGKIYNELPLNVRKIETKTVFTSYLNEHFSLRILSIYTNLIQACTVNKVFFTFFTIFLLFAYFS